MQRRLKRPPTDSLAKAVQPQWPSFTGNGTFVGTSLSGLVNVWYDAGLGSQALANARDLLADADRIISLDSAIFGTPDRSVNVILFSLDGQTDGTGGADHSGCDFSSGNNIEVCVSYGDPARVAALFEAELSECQMQGQLCGFSTGEALSRWCANTVSPHALDDFASAPVWQQHGMLNYVDTTDATDQNYDSIGCGMAFISWLIHVEGYPLNKIAPAMVSLGDSGTLAKLHAILSSGARLNAWPMFMAAVRALGSITSDDPFATTAPAPPPTPVPQPAPPSPPAAPLLRLFFPHQVPPGGKVSFAAPVAIPAGEYALVRIPGDQLAGVETSTASSGSG